MSRFRLLIALLFLSLNLNASEKHFSLALSGGVSLGAYEAGINWALLKGYKRWNETKGSYPKTFFKSAAGASAGGINTLLSAIYWCDQRANRYEKDTLDNVFSNAWLDVDIEDLLPDNVDYEGSNGNGLFNESKLQIQLAAIESQLKNFRQQKTTCGEVPLAVIVTSEEGKEVTYNSGLKIRNQRQVIPFYLKIDKGEYRFYQKRADFFKKEFGNVLMLKANSYNKGQLDISWQEIKQSVLSTSAFPVAFGKKKIAHCDYDLSNMKAFDKKLGCFKGSKLIENKYFVDGGVFDNIPIGPAKVLAESKPASKYTYLFINPDELRGEQKNSKKKEAQIESYGLKNQMLFLAGTLSTGRKYELYNELRRPEWAKEGKRNIEMTTRRVPVVGNMLGAFAAFFHKEFRIYDYYVGVFDGIYHLASSLKPKKEVTFRDYRQLRDLIFTQKQNTKEQCMFAILEKEQFNKEYPSWFLRSCHESIADTGVMYDIFHALEESQKSDNPFPDFLRGLEGRNFVSSKCSAINKLYCENWIFYNAYNSPSYWINTVLERATNRLERNEKEEEENYEIACKQYPNSSYCKKTSLEDAVSLINFGAKTMATRAPQDEEVYFPSTTSNFWNLLPYEFGANLTSGGAYIGYQFNIAKYNFLFFNDTTWNMFVKFGATLPSSKVTEASRTGSLTMGNEIHFPTFLSVSSLGVGYQFSSDLEGQFTKTSRILSGINIHIGLVANKIRLTYSQVLDDYNGISRAALFTITDVPGFIDLFL